ncbi:lachesin-like [Onthophagus taurus]|uniref:lachesin-like n=1 Tax=Onthophagus taurus TaxID=166361 RepID=UPI000C209EE7|nr:lachesin-like [Onthophagus taurus]XP_022913133.1 lachesin-like [Onthophagus taurus]
MLLLVSFLFVSAYSIPVGQPSQISSSMPFYEPVPDFNEPIRNVTAAVGREAVLSCTVNDLGQYKVGWMKADDQTVLSLDTRVITHNPRINVAHDEKLRTWQLRIRQLKESDRGCYVCQINTNSMKKIYGCIDVQVSPDIDDEGTSGDVTVTEKDNVTLTCRARGQPEPRVLWRREDSKHILLKETPLDVEKVDTFSGSTLNLFHLDRQQMGVYLCIASNDVPPAVSKRITLNINFPPLVHVVKPIISAPLGGSAKLKCDVESYPKSDNYWMKDREENLLNDSRHHFHEKKIRLRIIMTLTIFNVTANDLGIYRCIARNSVGKHEGSIRLYETPTTTTVTTPSTTTIILSTQPLISSEINFKTISLHFLTTTSKRLIPEKRSTEMDPIHEWFLPSVGPALLELETQSWGMILHPSTILLTFSIMCALLPHG